MEKFLNELHSRSDGYLIEFVALGKRTETKFVTSIPNGIAWAKKNHDCNLYVGVNPRNKKSSEVDAVEFVDWIWADIDAKNFDVSIKTLIKKTVESLPIPPHINVFTGGGIHLYWRIDPTQEFDKTKALCDMIADKIGGDRVGNRNRIMRLPGTYNYKRQNPVGTKVLYFRPELETYELTDIQGAFELNDKTVRKMHTDGHSGYKSRSEKDYGVVATLVRAGLSDAAIENIFEIFVVGKKAREEEENYLTRTIDKARDETGITVELASKILESDVFIEDGEATYRVSSGGDLQSVATFVFTPEILLEGDRTKKEADVFLGTISTKDDVWFDVQLPNDAFSSVSSLLKALPKVQWQWLDNDRSVRSYLPFLVKKWQALGEKTRKSTSVLGRHDDMFLAENICISPNGIVKDPPTVFVSSGRIVPELELNFAPEDQFVDTLIKFNELLPKVNKPEVVYPLVSWFTVSLIKTVLSDMGIKFPILNVFGIRGSGKTSMSTKVFQPMLGFKEPMLLSTADSTSFVRMAALNGTNCIPVCFGEFRYSTTKDLDRFLHHLRLSYDEGLDSRGRANLTTLEFELLSPIYVEGEDSITDAAFLERVIPVRLDPDTIGEGSTANRAFEELSEINIGHIAPYLIKFSLSYKPDFESSLEVSRKVLSTVRQPRIKNNFAVLHLGLKMYQSFCEKYGVEFKLPRMELLFFQAVSNILPETLSRTEMDVDLFVTDLINSIAMNPLHKEFLHKYDPEENRLYFQASSAYNWWSKTKRFDNTTKVPGIKAIKDQLRQLQPDRGEMVGNYVVGPAGAKSIGGQTVSCYAIDIKMCEEAGLDVPKNLVEGLD